MKKEIICGIYKITSPTGKIYIGQAKNIIKRWKSYKKSSCKNQPKICNSLSKYGLDAHIFEIIEECSEEDLNCRERFWQDEFEVIGEMGLNCLLTECDGERRVMSEDTVRRIKENHAMLGIIGIDNPYSKKCYQYDLEGDFIKEWNCIMDIQRELGFDNSLLTRCLKGNTRTCFNNQWFYEYKGEKIDAIKVGTHFMGTRNPELLNKMKDLWEEDKSLTCLEISIKLDVKLSTIRNLWQKHKEYISGSNKHRRKNNPCDVHLKNIKKASEILKQKRNGE